MLLPIDSEEPFNLFLLHTEVGMENYRMLLDRATPLTQKKKKSLMLFRLCHREEGGFKTGVCMRAL